MPIPVKENRQFCSRLVAQAYHSVGINLVKNPNFSSPEAINKSPLLVEVKDYLREATEKEIEFATATENTPLLKQQAITNEILEEARKISGEDIQTLVQLEELVIVRPELDGRIAYVLKKSSYLTMWQDEMKKNSWRYNYDDFVIDTPDSERRKKIALNEIKDATDMRMRYQSGLKMYTDAYDSAPSTTLGLLLNLSKELVHMSAMRDAVIRRVLE